MRYLVQLHARGIRQDETGGTLGLMAMRTVRAASPEEAVRVASLVFLRELVARYGEGALSQVAVRPRGILRISWYRWWRLNLPYVLLEDDLPWSD